MICNITQEVTDLKQVQPRLDGLLDQLPATDLEIAHWNLAYDQLNEGLAIPAQVNYVGKGARLYESGYQLDGSIHVIMGYLRFAFLLEKVRMRGGAYSAFAGFDPLTGDLTFLSYRDPNLVETINTYDSACDYLNQLQLEERELNKAIISAIGRTEPYRLPDAKGFTSMARQLTGITDEYRQMMRDQILTTTEEDFKSFGDVLEHAFEKGLVAVLGSEEKLEQANQAVEEPWLTITPIL
jgi:Zn-dependent M16 (insulinase) family peptidase